MLRPAARTSFAPGGAPSRRESTLTRGGLGGGPGADKTHSEHKESTPESERWNGSNKIRTIRPFVAEGARNIGAHYLQAGTDGRSRAQ
jgi:hypothetical protein